MELPRGLLLFVSVGFPWYMAMFAKHGMAYYNRFFIHDHFNRMNSGVHQIDSGTFEHFLKWLSYGMFPWVAFIPIALLLVFWQVGRRRKRADARTWFLLLWFFVSYLVFTVSSTKFHHYIFPALIPLGALVAYGITLFLREGGAGRRLGGVIGLALLGTVAWDMSGDPQTLRNLFTYKYDRPMPDHLPTDVDGVVAEGATEVWGNSLFYEETNAALLQGLNVDFFSYPNFLWVVAGICAFGLLLLLGRRTQRLGVFGFGLGALLFAIWGLNFYLVSFSVHWSQKYLFESYYDSCTLREQSRETEESYTPMLASIGLGGISDGLGATSKRVCEEDIISWLITWRGETYYGNNEVIPIQKEATQFEAYLRDYNRGKTFFVLMERGKEKSWQKKLNGTYLPKVKEDKGFENVGKFGIEKLHDENRYFILVKVTPEPKKK